MSTVTGTWIDGTHLDAEYWANNLRQPVLFGQALTQLLEQGHDTFIEISPHPILLMAIEEARRPSGRGREKSREARASQARKTFERGQHSPRERP